MSQSPNVPPMFAEPLEVDPPSWPKTVGIVSIVLASLGILCGFCGFAWLGFVMNASFMQEAMTKQMGSAMPQELKPTGLQMTQMIAGTLWTFVLLFAGIATARRRENGRMLHLVYSAVSLVLGIVGLLIYAKSYSTINAWIAANPDNRWATQQKQGQAFGPFMVCGVSLITMGWPLFCLIWFGVKGKNPAK